MKHCVLPVYIRTYMLSVHIEAAPFGWSVQVDLDRSMHEEELKERQDELNHSRRSLRWKEVELRVRVELVVRYAGACELHNIM